jgi:hypothetical protein
MYLVPCILLVPQLSHSILWVYDSGLANSKGSRRGAGVIYFVFSGAKGKGSSIIMKMWLG